MKKRPEGVTLLALLHFTVTTLVLLAAAGGIGYAFLPLRGSGGVGLPNWAILGLVVGVMVPIGWAVLSLVAGWGLLQMKEWARWLTIGLAVLGIFLFPVGTLISGLAIWYLVQREIVAAFQSA